MQWKVGNQGMNMEQYENMNLEELLNARIELRKKKNVALQSTHSLTVMQQFAMMESELNHQIILRQSVVKDDDKPDDLDDILNIG